MKIKKGFLVFCATLFSVLTLQAQDNTSMLLRKVYNKLQMAKDYSVVAKIRVDIPFIRLVPVDVEIYYKQPDKFKVKSKSITIVPRQGFDQASKMLADTSLFTVMYQGNERIGMTQTSIVNIIPLSDTSDLILGKLWIDPKTCIILKSQLTTKSSGTILTEYTYGKMIAYGLPDKMVFSVDIKKFRLPKEVITDMKESERKEDRLKKDDKGKIIIALRDYQVNKGIPDSVFDK